MPVKTGTPNMNIYRSRISFFYFPFKYHEKNYYSISKSLKPTDDFGRTERMERSLKMSVVIF